VNPLVSSFLAGILRQLLFGVGVWFVTKGYFTESEMANYMAAFIAFLISVGGMLWTKYSERLKFLTAAGASVPMSEATIEQKVKEGAAPSALTPKNVTPQTIVTLLLAIGLATSLTACASANRGMANAEDRIHDAIAAIDDRVRAECPPPADLKHVLAEVCQEARKEVEAVRETGQAFNEAVTERKISSLGPLITAAGRLQTASVKGFNALMQTELARQIRQIIEAAATLSTQVPATSGGRQ
jgi:hypothetical protein